LKLTNYSFITSLLLVKNEDKLEKKKKRKRSKYDENSILKESDIEVALLGKSKEPEGDLSDKGAFEAAM
jgi:hypothetical protein